MGATISYFRLALYDISQLLNTQLNRETLATCVSMIESGVNPEALAVSWVDRSDQSLILAPLDRDQGTQA